jgi:inner membrane protein
LSGPWADPSFDGEFLPATREVTETGFTASWKVLHFNRPFSQQWTQDNQQLSGADFGIKLLIPVDQYQKSIRTSKYGVLIILLTFIALFLVEITQKIRIHPFQYILIGAALTIYYTLLLSFSEHVGYNVAYIIASLATVILISLYSISFLGNTKLIMLFSLLLITFYSFIFVIILQQDFSLLLGSIGLFFIVGLLMYFSRKVNWYREASA